MPLVIHPRVRKAAGRIAAMTCVAVFASTGAAFAACRPQQASTPFAHWGDTNNYFLVPGGSFEGSADQVGWSLTNASLTAGNEPFHVGGYADNQSLTIDSSGSGISPSFCEDNTMPYLRFFARQTAPGSDLIVEAVSGLGGHQVASSLAVLRDKSMSSWGPVHHIGLQVRLPGMSRLPVTLRFVVPGGAGSWQIDDVYVDPFRLG